MCVNVKVTWRHLVITSRTRHHAALNSVQRTLAATCLMRYVKKNKNRNPTVRCSVYLDSQPRCYTVLTQQRRVTDGRTDRPTDKKLITVLRSA